MRNRKAESKAFRPPSEQIKASIGVVELVRQYVELDPQGRGYCPFHEDRHKSFGVKDQSNFWSWFAGCDSIIDFWQKWRQKTVKTQISLKSLSETM
jgi:DNA primase